MLYVHFVGVLQASWAIKSVHDSVVIGLRYNILTTNSTEEESYKSLD